MQISIVKIEELLPTSKKYKTNKNIKRKKLNNKVVEIDRFV